MSTSRSPRDTLVVSAAWFRGSPPSSPTGEGTSVRQTYQSTVVNTDNRVIPQSKVAAAVLATCSLPTDPVYFPPISTARKRGARTLSHEGPNRSLGR